MKRWILYFAGLNLLAFGIVLNISTGLGVAALSSSIYATSVIFKLSLGTASILWYLIFVVIQCTLAGKIKKEFLLEIPLSFAFGYLNDFYDFLIDITPPDMFAAVLLMIAAVACSSLGVFITTKTDLVLNPGDGIVKTISSISGRPFHFMKNCFDICMILCSLCMGLVSGHGIIGIGVGTVFSALFTGRFIKLWDQLFGEKMVNCMA